MIMQYVFMLHTIKIREGEYMDKVIITISREYGSGGRIIGEKVAEMLGIPFYNHNLIDMIAHESGLDKDYISQWQERVSSPMLWGWDAAIAGFIPEMTAGYYSNELKMFEAQSKIIRDLAEKGSCVIVGRCGGYLLKNDPSCLRVFIYSDKESRINRILEEYDAETLDQAEDMLKSVDKSRAAYHEKYTLTEWGDYLNYDIALDSKLGIDECAKIIVEAAKAKINK
ncbi:MAG: cytidylate kinase-like family protein [Anaerofustis stercorihominis]|nr:cytidylate kinase-like family protein [Anaerofustis stercorihominis]